MDEKKKNKTVPWQVTSKMFYSCGKFFGNRDFKILFWLWIRGKPRLPARCDPLEGTVAQRLEFQATEEEAGDKLDVNRISRW